MTRRGASAVLAVGAIAVVLGRGALADQPAPAATPAAAAPAPAASPVAKFDHAAHARLDKPVDIAKCSQCHTAGADGALVAPGGKGHQPCLASGCHVDDFLAVSPRAQKERPTEYADAARFCAGCHTAGAPGAAPSRSSQPKADAAWKGNPSPDHHVELDHLEHTGKTACHNCHTVDAQSFALKAGAPGHAQCASCHGAAGNPDAAPMSQCQTCHKEPDAKAYFGAAARPSSDVRSCDTDSHRALVAKHKDAVPCFKHERVEHRVQDGAPLECKSCHFMVDDEKQWGRFKYRSLKELRASPIIHNQRDLAHASCGTSGCHRRDVDDSAGNARCSLCHSKKLIDTGLFD